MNPNTGSRLRTTVYYTITADGAVLLDSEKGLYFSVNDTGATILDALKDEQDEASIVARLVQEYSCGEEEARADVRAFLNQLQEAGLLRR